MDKDALKGKKVIVTNHSKTIFGRHIEKGMIGVITNAHWHEEYKKYVVFINFQIDEQIEYYENVGGKNARGWQLYKETPRDKVKNKLRHMI